MATLATVKEIGNALLFTGGIGVNAADVVIQTADVSEYGEFLLMSGAGAMAVFGSLDGTIYSTTAIAMQDLGSTSLTTSVLVTAALRVYRIIGPFKTLQVQQSGAVAVTGATLRCASGGSTL